MKHRREVRGVAGMGAGVSDDAAAGAGAGVAGVAAGTGVDAASGLWLAALSGTSSAAAGAGVDVVGDRDTSEVMRSATRSSPVATLLRSRPTFVHYSGVPLGNPAASQPAQAGRSSTQSTNCGDVSNHAIHAPVANADIGPGLGRDAGPETGVTAQSNAVHPDSFWQLGDPVSQTLGVDLLGTDEGPWHRLRKRMAGCCPPRRALRSCVAFLGRSWKRLLGVCCVLAVLAVLVYAGLMIASGLRGDVSGLSLPNFGAASPRNDNMVAAPSNRNAPSQSAAASDSGAASASSPTSQSTTSQLGTQGRSVPRGIVIADLVDDAWAQDIAQRSGVPVDYVKAYAGASILAQRERPHCGIGWNMLGGIGEVESDHGTKHDPGKLIRGPVLDGSDGTGAVPDTDGGKLDGDPIWDRAVGPMQFLPSTWARYGRDGDGDARADPNDINDAALTAAGYLCTAGGDLTTSQGWITAVEAYNRGSQYNAAVADAANRLGAL